MIHNAHYSGERNGRGPRLRSAHDRRGISAETTELGPRLEGGGEPSQLVRVSLRVLEMIGGA